MDRNVVQAMADKDKTIAALSKALTMAYDALESAPYAEADELDDLVEVTQEEIIAVLMEAGVSREHIPG